MGWFSADAFAFFRELEQNNNKAWFEENRKRFETSVQKPVLAFAEEMIGRMLELDPHVVRDAKKSVMRYYRDTRFSKDKSPYKICASMIISNGGKGDHATPGFYFSLTGGGTYLASGAYELEPTQLKAVRELIVANEAEFNALIANPAFVDKFGEIQGVANKVMPSEFKEAAKRIPLLANKQFFYAANLSDETVMRDDLPDLAMEYMRAAWPLNQFLAKAL